MAAMHPSFRLRVLLLLRPDQIVEDLSLAEQMPTALELVNRPTHPDLRTIEKSILPFRILENPVTWSRTRLLSSGRRSSSTTESGSWRTTVSANVFCKSSESICRLRLQSSAAYKTGRMQICPKTGVHPLVKWSRYSC